MTKLGENQPMIVVSRNRRVDWAKVLANLATVGADLEAVSKETGCPVGTLKGYRFGATDIEPAFWVGYRLLALWSQRLNVPVSDAPMKTVTPSVSQVLRESA